ncbi:hypothetical protein ASE95_13395 [Sphingomonas sp. Leaf231]|uniref:hypothetical protein n=1 Tax=Sphingomonas sp. Leaf231 TaxID=1736301 RepID=UPI0006FBEC16|nr:hypothetical protein [Sphingomonas sp. Leaf231]KQN90474.1 hypothetical protein ASE95_13395 [Sphingomonas sp. Leaf231]
MRYLMTFTAAAALGAVAVVAAPVQKPAKPDRNKLAYEKLLAGKTPGKPQDCIDTRLTRPQLTAYDGKLLYRVSKKLVYVTETGGGCEAVARGDAIVTRQFQTRLCRGDIAQTVNLPARIPSGSCAMGAFVPYRSQ